MPLHQYFILFYLYHDFQCYYERDCILLFYTSMRFKCYKIEKNLNFVILVLDYQYIAKANLFAVPVQSILQTYLK